MTATRCFQLAEHHGVGDAAAAMLKSRPSFFLDQVQLRFKAHGLRCISHELCDSLCDCVQPAT